jgi:hypothetical protein
MNRDEKYDHKYDCNKNNVTTTHHACAISISPLLDPCVSISISPHKEDRKDAKDVPDVLEEDHKVALGLHRQLNGNMVAPPFSSDTLRMDVDSDGGVAGNNTNTTDPRRFRREYEMSSCLESLVFGGTVLLFVCFVVLVLGLALNECSDWLRTRCFGLWLGMIGMLVLGAFLLYCHINGGPMWPGVCCHMHCPTPVVDRLVGDDPDANSSLYLPRHPFQDVPCCLQSCPCCYRVRLVF